MGLRRDKIAHGRRAAEGACLSAISTAAYLTKPSPTGRCSSPAQRELLNKFKGQQSGRAGAGARRRSGADLLGAAAAQIMGGLFSAQFRQNNSVRQ
jgi:hypothetical protein